MAKAKKPKLDADAMMLDTLSVFEGLGCSGIQIGNTTYKKKGKNTLEITTRKRVKTASKKKKTTKKERK